MLVDSPSAALPPFARRTIMSTVPDREQLSLVPPRGRSAPGASSGRVDALQEQVRARFGLLPNLFSTAHSAPELTEELWRFARSAYLDSPLPSLFKERLFVHLSRFCANRYCIVRHGGFLLGNGHAAGDFEAIPQRMDEVLALLGRPVPDMPQLQTSLALLESRESVITLPDAGAALEVALFDALTILFVMPGDADRARLAITHAIGERRFEILTALLAFVRTAHFWTETHPSLQFEGDMIALMQEHPALAAVLLDTSGAEWAHSAPARRAADELLDADRRKDEFLAMLAHELRNPLATLRNGLYLARRKVPADAPLMPVIQMMSRQLAMLVHLVDDLTDVSRISTGKIRIRREQLVVQDVVAASIESSQSAVDARGHALRVLLPEERLCVAGDFDRLVQVFSNLLCNAVKYTEPGGFIEMQVACDAGSAVVSVRDTGIGIAGADVAGIFDLFSQIPAHGVYANGGLGIGLALVRQLVELHDGSVSVASGGQGQGSTFTVRLPLSPAWPRQDRDRT
jgi:signal transduction histidine kinase